MNQNEENPDQLLVNILLESTDRMKAAAEVIKKVEANVARLTDKVLAASPERLVAVASSSLVESGEEVGRKLQTILRRELASAEYTRQEAKAESRRCKLAVLCLVVAFLAFGGGFTAALSLQQLGLVAFPR